MTLNRNDYKLFTKTDFQNIMGEDLDSILYNSNINNGSEYMITYTSNLISQYIFSRSGRRLFKSYENSSPDNYTLKYGKTEQSSVVLSEKVIEKLKLACVYQCAYMIDNGSPERMSGLSIASRTAVLSKEDLTSYQISDMTQRYLTDAGLLYAGIGGGAYAWIK